MDGVWSVCGDQTLLLPVGLVQQTGHGSFWNFCSLRSFGFCWFWSRASSQRSSAQGPSAPLQASAVPIVPVTSKRTSCSQAQERDASGIHCPPVLALGGASGEWPEGCVLLPGVLRGGWS